MASKFLIAALTVLLATCRLQAQSADILAQSAMLNAEDAYNNDNLDESLDYLEEAEKILGKTNSRIQYLKVKSYIAIGSNNGYDKEALIRADQELKIFFDVTNENTYSAEKYDEMVKELAHIRKLIKDAENEEQRIKSARAEFNRNDEAAFNSARQMNTVEAYNLYIKNYPGGKHVEEAKQGLEIAEKKEKSAAKLQEYNNYIRKHPKDQALYKQRGLLKYDYEDYQGAIQDFSTALELKPGKSDEQLLYYYRGFARGYTREYPGAVSDLSKYIQSDTKDASAYTMRGVCYFNLNELENSTNDMDKALELKPSAYAYYIKGQISYENRDFQAAISNYTKAINIDPNGNYYWFRGYNKYLIDDHLGAIEDFNHVLNKDPSNGDALFLRAKAYLELKAYEDAKNDFAKVLQSRIDSTYLAYSYYYLGKKDTAYNILKTLEKTRKNKAGVFYDLACLYSLDNKKTESIDALRKAFENGYKNVNWALGDDDLTNINKEKEFTDLINMYSK